MPQTFLVLFAAGTLLATALSDPAQVTLRWLRLDGLVSLALVTLSAVFLFSDEPRHAALPVWMLGAFFGLIAAQLVLVQLARPRPARVVAFAGYLLGAALGCVLLPPTPFADIPSLSIAYAAWMCWAIATSAALCGLALMDMLLGHAYLTASTMTLRPFKRLNNAEMLWGIEGLLIGTRWLVGLAAPGALVYMAHDCIARRSTQSATGILYLAGVLIFIGELIALMLIRDTHLPF
jgi:hypothetical protein